MMTTRLMAVTALLAAMFVGPALARDGHRPRHRHVVHAVVDRGPPVASNPLEVFLHNGNQPYFDGYDGGVGYMGYYRRGYGPEPVLVTGPAGCAPGWRSCR